MLTLLCVACTPNTSQLGNSSCDPNSTTCESMNGTMNVSDMMNDSVESDVVVDNEVVGEPVETDMQDASVPTKRIKEGELVSVKSNIAQDEDGDTILYTYSAPLNASGEWQTQIGDAGTYDVTITAFDGEVRSELKARIVVEAVNLAPSITQFSSFTAQEGQEIVLNPLVVDPDGDEFDVTYVGWMTMPRKVTTYTDAGMHEVTLVVSDGFHVVNRTITITVANVNRAPVISRIGEVVATEGELVALSPQVTDPDGDPARVMYGAPFDASGVWQTKRGDAGRYDVVVTASDGDMSSTQTVSVLVERLNHAPQIMMNATVYAKEGEVLLLNPVVSDSDGDEIRLTYSGWMDEARKTLGYEDAGEHQVVITASDGFAQSQFSVTIIVQNVNRPPEFVDDIFE